MGGVAFTMWKVESKHGQWEKENVKRKEIRTVEWKKGHQLEWKATPKKRPEDPNPLSAKEMKAKDYAMKKMIKQNELFKAFFHWQSAYMVRRRMKSVLNKFIQSQLRSKMCAFFIKLQRRTHEHHISTVEDNHNQYILSLKNQHNDQVATLKKEHE